MDEDKHEQGPELMSEQEEVVIFPSGAKITARGKGKGRPRQREVEQPARKSSISDRSIIELIFAQQKILLTTPPAEPAREQVGPMSSKAYQRPLPSLAHSCHPVQVKEFNEDAKAAGLTGVHYSADGKAHFSSRGQRKAWNKYRGLVDKDGGYGD